MGANERSSALDISHIYLEHIVGIRLLFEPEQLHCEWLFCRSARQPGCERLPWLQLPTPF